MIKNFLKILSAFILIQVSFVSCIFINKEYDFDMVLKKGELDDLKSRYNRFTGDDWASSHVKDFIMNNNVWNKKKTVDCEQYIFTEDKTGSTVGGWAWRWPYKVNKLWETYSYPQFTYGKKPWIQENTSAVLPISVSNRDILFDYDVNLTATGHYNLALDVWICTKSSGNVQDIAMEFMIWLVDTPGIIRAGSLKDKILIDGKYYRVYFARGPYFTADYNGKPFVTIVADKQDLKGRINIGKFIEYMIRHKYIQEGMYLTCIEFGNEIFYGAGECIVNSLSIQFP